MARVMVRTSQGWNFMVSEVWFMTHFYGLWKIVWLVNPIHRTLCWNSNFFWRQILRTPPRSIHHYMTCKQSSYNLPKQTFLSFWSQTPRVFPPVLWVRIKTFEAWFFSYFMSPYYDLLLRAVEIYTRRRWAHTAVH